jgi:hypothetical protein
LSSEGSEGVGVSEEGGEEFGIVHLQAFDCGVDGLYHIGVGHDSEGITEEFLEAFAMTTFKVVDLFVNEGDVTATNEASHRFLGGEVAGEDAVLEVIQEGEGRGEDAIGGLGGGGRERLAGDVDTVVPGIEAQAIVDGGGIQIAQLQGLGENL